ncbi:outer membrane protein [Paracoccus seriniphilus]|uniref:Opacity protein n=1 Tax=Paracoccus seriniphilus TaxID=184748 RepID=A0A239PMS0_9RHOB|nr:porin family protein [Paracoccus seriniphilus]WCR13726.1 porin family protein [Paracoccus seriniphilus]SNT68669.1 Opacity protein [Paracoccus seriniphilus]
MKLVIAAVTSSLIAGSAYAGGYTAPVVEPSPEPITVSPVVNDVSNWTGFYAGAQYGQGSADFNNGLGDSDADAYGVHAGYNYDLGNWVVGGELDYNKVDADDLDDKGDMTRLRARAGYDMGKFMPYVTLGAAHLSQDIPGGDISETDVTYGIGAEYKVTEQFTVGAEYTKQDFSDVADVDGLDLDTDMVQMRASFRF